MTILQGLSLARAVAFSHKGRDYEIRIFSDGYNMVVKAFKGVREANGIAHSVTLPVAFDMKRQTGIEPIEMLIDDAKQDIVEERWEKYLKACAEEKKRQRKAAKA